MKLKDIKVGEKYVISGPGMKWGYRQGRRVQMPCEPRTEVMAGESGTLVEVMGIGSFTTLPGECGRQEVIPAPERSDVGVWVRYDQERTVGTKTEVVTTNAVLQPQSLLLTAGEWKAKSAAYRKEQRRIEQAIKTHERTKAELIKVVSEGLGARPSNRDTREPGWQLDQRYVKGPPAAEYRPTVELDLDVFVRLVGRNGKRKAVDALVELARLQHMSTAEITC